MLSDRDIREALMIELRAFAPKKSIIINEFGVWNNRIDVALVENCLIGYEIKSDKDTLVRIPEQEALYSKIFDYVSIVCTNKHKIGIWMIIPSWYGIIEAYPDVKKEVGLRTFRVGTKNLHLDKKYCAGLLWRNESLQLLDKYLPGHKLLYKTKKMMHEKLANILTLDELHKEIIDTFKKREWADNRDIVEVVE
jgi:hypothetical protein